MTMYELRKIIYSVINNKKENLNDFENRLNEMEILFKKRNFLTKLNEKGYENLVKLLLINGADVNARGDGGVSSLHFAANKGYKEIVELLIAHGANVNAKTNNNVTPLHFAVNRNHRNIANIIRGHGGKF